MSRTNFLVDKQDSASVDALLDAFGARGTEYEAAIREAPEQWLLMQPNWPSDHAAARAHR